MRTIGTLQDLAMAQRFGDYLVTKGIRNEVEPDDAGGHVIWIVEEDQIDQAAELFVAFRANPASSDFTNVQGTASRIREAEEKERVAYLKRVRTRKSLFPRISSYGVGILTYILIIVSVVVALKSNIGRNPQAISGLFIVDVLSDRGEFLHEVMEGQVWRLVTPIFIHFGFFHILFNMMWLYQLGSMIEGRQSSLVLGVLILLIAVLSNVAEYAIKGPSFGGMSGVVYGLAGYVWFHGKHHPASGLFLDEQNRLWLMIWMVICFLGWVGPVANWVHLVGFLTGSIYGRVSAYFASKKPEE